VLGLSETYSFLDLGDSQLLPSDQHGRHLLSLMEAFSVLFSIGMVEHLGVHLPLLTVPLMFEKIVGRFSTALGIGGLIYSARPILSPSWQALFAGLWGVVTVQAYSQGALHAELAHGAVVVSMVFLNLSMAQECTRTA
jgi:hypothetical protein